MKNPYKDITGQRFGRLIAVQRISEKYKKTKWLCKCDCGNTKELPLDSLSSGRGNSCGCLRKENTSRTFKKHGKTATRLHGIWLGMKQRCTNPKLDSYKNYGARGIKVCEEWSNDFIVFENWSLANGYHETLTIDRIDNDGNYEPSNCRWTDWNTQMNNTSTNVYIEIEGVVRTLADHSKFYGIDYGALHYRYEQGLLGMDLIKPTKKKILIELDGETKNLKEWARHFGICYGTIQCRYTKGLRGKELFKPVDKIASEKAKMRKRESA